MNYIGKTLKAYFKCGIYAYREGRKDVNAGHR